METAFHSAHAGPTSPYRENMGIAQKHTPRVAATGRLTTDLPRRVFNAFCKGLLCYNQSFVYLDELVD